MAALLEYQSPVNFCMAMESVESKQNAQHCIHMAKYTIDLETEK